MNRTLAGEVSRPMRSTRSCEVRRVTAARTRGRCRWPSTHYRRGSEVCQTRFCGRMGEGGRSDGNMATPVLRVCCVAFWVEPILAEIRGRGIRFALRGKLAEVCQPKFEGVRSNRTWRKLIHFLPLHLVPTRRSPPNNTNPPHS